MKIYICSLISKKNQQFLNSHLNSINQLKKPKNYSFKMVFVIHPKIISYKNLFKKSLNKIDYVVLKSTKDNIPYSRNIFLKFIKNQNFKYAGFFDDDCIVDKDWLLNMIKFMNQNNCDIVGGPQKHKVKNIVFKNYYDILEPRRKHGELVKWVATNNCFFSKKIVEPKIFFNIQFASYGGSDQLFFKKLYKEKFTIKWNMKSYTTENYNLQREKKLWFLKRNLRYGYSGNLIDKEIYGKMSLIIIIIKIFYLICNSLILLLIPNRKSSVKASFFLLRAIGRFLGLFNYKPKKYI